ncbi:hypothetical protein EB232_34365 (plasmid) [Mesorhizobium sp. NZP2077]|nr:hypothetical protein EB232_34365 [Mesorhizobium sp. NZP2077]
MGHVRLRFLIGLIFCIDRPDDGVNRPRIWQKHYLCILGHLGRNSGQVNITPNGTTLFLNAALLFNLYDEWTGLLLHMPFLVRNDLPIDRCLSGRAL